MKPIKCEVHWSYLDWVQVTYYSSIRKALKYCKRNGISRQCIYVRDGSVLRAVFGNGIILEL